MKSSGAFSSLANGVSDSILKYEGTINNAILSENIYKDNFTKSLDLSSSIFDYRYIRYNVNILDKYYNSYQPQYGYKLLINDTMILSRYANILELFKQVILGYVWQLQGVKSTAKSLIPFLKKEYRLK